MQKIISLILILNCFVLTANSQDKKNSGITYTCPMHPEIQSKIPGICPICKMKLVEDKSKKKKPESKKVKVKTHTSPKLNSASYTCPMHPEIKSANPGSCPKCGMDLVKIKQERLDSIPLNEGSDDTKTHDHAEKDIASPDLNILQSMKTISNNIPPRTVRYDLYVRDTLVTFGKKSKRAIAVNGQIPMPALTFTEGDTAEIWVYNELKEETSLHWHGLFLPNNMDGVPFLTQMPISPGDTFLYKFPIIQHGTHWYHSHTKLQEQIGMYGMFIMNKRAEPDIPTIPIVISEWTDMRPEEVHRSLKSATDWFAIKKGSTQSYSEAIREGHFGTKITNEWKRMNAMDVSDVYYDRFLINGQNKLSYNEFKWGDKIRLRIANGGASDYFWLTYSGGKITVVASDGNDVVPVEVDRLLIAVSETYDVILTIPDNKSYEFLITPEDRTNSASLWLGNGEQVPATRLPTLKYFEGMKMMNDMMDMQGNIVEVPGMVMQNQVMDMNVVMYPEIMDKKSAENQDHTAQGHSANQSNDNVTLNYAMLRSPIKTTLPEGPVKELKFDLTGNMDRYVWSLNDKVVSESDKILIKKGETVRIILFNNSMMRHPMHLHGHDFRLLNGQGEYAPMKNIIDIMPMERDTIEFYTSEPGGDWFFHCHILYHMMSGMGRVLSYENSPSNFDIEDVKVARRGLYSDDRRFHLMGRLGIETNGSDGEIMLGQTRWNATAMWHLGFHEYHGYETEIMVGRYLGKMQWWNPYVGFDYHYKKEKIQTNHENGIFTLDNSPENIFGNEEKTWFGQTSNKNSRRAAIIGVGYTLPLLFAADLRVDSEGKFRFQLSREDIPISRRLRFAIMLNTDKEYMSGFRYILTKYIAASTHYDSDMGLGVGVTVTY